MEARLSRLEDAVPRLEGTLDRFEVQVDARLHSLEQSVASANAKLDVLAGVDDELHRVERDLDARLRQVEQGLDARLRQVEQRLAALDGKMDLLVGQVVGKLPSWWQMPAVIGATVVLLTALYAGIQYLRAHGLL